MRKWRGTSYDCLATGNIWYMCTNIHGHIRTKHPERSGGQTAGKSTRLDRATRRRVDRIVVRCWDLIHSSTTGKPQCRQKKLQKPLSNISTGNLQLVQPTWLDFTWVRAAVGVSCILGPGSRSFESWNSLSLHHSQWKWFCCYSLPSQCWLLKECNSREVKRLSKSWPRSDESNMTWKPWMCSRVRIRRQLLFSSLGRYELMVETLFIFVKSFNLCRPVREPSTCQWP